MYNWGASLVRSFSFRSDRRRQEDPVDFGFSDDGRSLRLPQGQTFVTEPTDEQLADGRWTSSHKWEGYGRVCVRRWRRLLRGHRQTGGNRQRLRSLRQVGGC